MATHSSVLAWRIPGTAGPGGLPSMGSHRNGHNWSDLAAAAAVLIRKSKWRGSRVLSTQAAGLVSEFLWVLSPSPGWTPPWPLLILTTCVPTTWTRPLWDDHDGNWYGPWNPHSTTWLPHDMGKSPNSLGFASVSSPVKGGCWPQLNHRAAVGKDLACTQHGVSLPQMVHICREWRSMWKADVGWWRALTLLKTHLSNPVYNVVRVTNGTSAISSDHQRRGGCGGGVAGGAGTERTQHMKRCWGHGWGALGAQAASWGRKECRVGSAPLDPSNHPEPLQPLGAGGAVMWPSSTQRHHAKHCRGYRDRPAGAGRLPQKCLQANATSTLIQFPSCMVLVKALSWASLGYWTIWLF